MSDSPNARLLEAAKAGDIGGIRAAIADGADRLALAKLRAVSAGQGLAAAYLDDLLKEPLDELRRRIIEASKVIGLSVADLAGAMVVILAAMQTEEFAASFPSKPAG